MVKLCWHIGLGNRTHQCDGTCSAGVLLRALSLLSIRADVQQQVTGRECSIYGRSPV